MNILTKHFNVIFKCYISHIIWFLSIGILKYILWALNVDIVPNNFFNPKIWYLMELVWHFIYSYNKFLQNGFKIYSDAKPSMNA